MIEPLECLLCGDLAPLLILWHDDGEEVLACEDCFDQILLENPELEHDIENFEDVLKELEKDSDDGVIFHKTK